MCETGKLLRNEFIGELVKKMGNERKSLLPILQEIQKKYHYIDEHSQQVVADLLNIHPVEVNSVISFYAFLYDAPRGRNIVRVCKNIVCEFHGSKGIAKALSDELGIEFDQTTEDGRVTLEYANCFGMCDKSPSILINDKIHEKVSKETALKLIRELK
ncbi:MAG: NAD(P)H-dependent oxidoreductase subunit E [Ignavibacteriae bacterium]|nr:NAD(P)H-dependent oxidoreductase subunit E [Ignavibacteriota bacterium]